MIVLSIIVVIIGFYVYKLAKKYQEAERLAKFMDKLPGDKRYPFIGTSYRSIGVKPEELYALRRNITETYKPLFTTWLGFQPNVHLMKPDHLEVVMNSMKQIKKGEFYRLLEVWFGKGLLTSDGEKWHRNRKLITPTFHFQILDNFMDVFVEKSEILVKLLSSKADGKVFNIYPFITHCTLDIICETAMGVQIGAMSGKNQDYVDAVYGLAQLIGERGLKPWLWPDVIYKFTKRGIQHDKYLKMLHNFTDNVIRDRKATLQNKIDRSEGTTLGEPLLDKKRQMAFLDLLIQASKNGTILSDKEIREEVDTFMFEGHDTTTAAICWSLFLLGNHPDIQEKVFEEIEEFFSRKSDPIKSTDLNDLKYLERVIKESLRIFPSVPIIVRQLQEDIVVDGYTIPSGVMAFLHIYDVHRDPQIFPDPERFDPDRFLPEAAKNRHPYAYIPFSAGPRNCIGQKFAMIEEKIILAYFLYNYKIRSTEEQGQIKRSADLILKPQDGLFITLEPRNSS